jgi:NAD(P)-dependent dehydrogenase (short-subunit alcohol dehydrogenase family)
LKKGTFIITGGNAGIGKATAVELSKLGKHVVIVSRNAEKGGIALEDIKRISNNSDTKLMIGDLSSIDSTKKLASNLLEKFPDISVLINNAAIWPLKPQINTDGFEMTFMVNHIAPFILSNMLLDTLKKNAPSRIINVNARLYDKGKIDLDKTPFGKDFGKLATYMNTKLCNIYFTQKFAEIIQGSGVTINANHPGVIRTNLGVTGGLFGVFLKSVKWFWKTPEEGAKPVVWLATASEVEKVNGQYFELCVQKPYSKNACDHELREKLWDFSKKLTSI